MPLMSYNLIESIDLLANASTILARKCVDGIEANVARATELVERDIIIITALAPRVGYDKAAEIAHVAMDTNRGVREVALEMSGLDAKELDEVLDLKKMTEGGVL
jgi:fumarate hydratase class II